jgi:16S rRNA (uracil1498-N3)-methyltransferase
MSERFYINCPLRPGSVVIQGPEAHHLAVVCRLRPGDPICLFNGDGHDYPAHVLEIQRRQVTVHIDGVVSVQRELGFPLVLAAPLPKGDRAHFLVEKLTEIGVTSFVPLTSRRSVIEPRESRLEKLRRQVIEASKQCGRNVLMTVETLTSWETFCQRRDWPGLKVLAHPGGTAPSQLETKTRSETGFTLAVGPEGGFTDQELDLARAAGWLLVDMGPRILRMETAAVVLAAWAILSLQ